MLGGGGFLLIERTRNIGYQKTARQPMQGIRPQGKIDRYSYIYSNIHAFWSKSHKKKPKKKNHYPAHIQTLRIYFIQDPCRDPIPKRRFARCPKTESIELKRGVTKIRITKGQVQASRLDDPSAVGSSAPPSIESPVPEAHGQGG